MRELHLSGRVGLRLLRDGSVELTVSEDGWSTYQVLSPEDRSELIDWLLRARNEPRGEEYEGHR